MRLIKFIVCLMVIAGIAACDVRKKLPDLPVKVAESDFVTTASGLKYYDIRNSTGVKPESGQMVTVHYTGWLLNGEKFDSSLKRGKPFSFRLKQGQVIPGWDEGVSTMRVGSKRQMVIPSILGYDDIGFPGRIPPDATLVFEIELLKVE